MSKAQQNSRRWGEIYNGDAIIVMSYKGSYSKVRGHLLRILCFGIKPCKEVKQERILEMKSG